MEDSRPVVLRILVFWTPKIPKTLDLNRSSFVKSLSAKVDPMVA